MKSSKDHQPNQENLLNDRKKTKLSHLAMSYHVKSRTRRKQTPLPLLSIPLGISASSFPHQTQVKIQVKPSHPLHHTQRSTDRSHGIPTSRTVLCASLALRGPKVPRSGPWYARQTLSPASLPSQQTPTRRSVMSAWTSRGGMKP